MATQLFSNNIQTTLSSDITNVQTSITLTDGSGLNAPGATEYELITFTDGTDYEIVSVTARSGNVITVTRAQEGTTAAAWASAETTVFSGPTAGSMDQFPQGFDNGGNAKGADSVTLQPGRATAAQVASGSSAIAIGYAAEASGSFSTAIGRTSRSAANSATSLGISARALGIQSTALGVGAYANNAYSTALGNYIDTSFDYVLRTAGVGQISAHPGYNIGFELNYCAGPSTILTTEPIDLAGGTVWSSGLTPHNGDTVRPTTPNGFQYQWADYAYPYNFSTSYTPTSVGTTEPTWPITHGDSVEASSANGDFYAIDNSNYALELPTYARMVVTAIDVVVHAFDSITVQPTINIGTQANGTALVNGLQLTDTTARYAVEHIVLANSVSVPDIKIDIATLATGGKLLVNFYFHGYVYVDPQFYVV